MWQAAVDYAREVGKEDPDDEEDPDRWLAVWCEGSREGYRDGAEEVLHVTDPSRADRLSIAVSGRGAFRRFKDALVPVLGDQHRVEPAGQQRPGDRVAGGGLDSRSSPAEGDPAQVPDPGDSCSPTSTSAAQGGSDNCVINSATTTCMPQLLANGDAVQAKASFDSYVQPIEVRNALGFALSGDPRPFDPTSPTCPRTASSTHVYWPSGVRVACPRWQGR